MAQIRQVVSESLQATIRRLLPSQQGFTEDLQASNVIFPIIDLTPSAEGDSLPTDLARAMSFQGVTAFSVNNAVSTIINTPGFYRVFGAASVNRAGAGVIDVYFELEDGATNKRIWAANAQVGTEFFIANFDFVIFLAAGETLEGAASNNLNTLAGNYRQIADVNGNLVLPAGYSAS